MLEWLNEENGLFDRLRFRGAVFYASKGRVKFTFSSPEPLTPEAKELLFSRVREQQCCGLTFETELVPDRQTHETLRAAMFEFLKESFYSVFVRFGNGGYYINKVKDKDEYDIVFKLNRETHELFMQMELIDKLNAFFADYTVTPVKASYVLSESSEDFDETVKKIEAQQHRAAADMVFSAKRTIPIKNVKGIIGRAIKDSPTFISETVKEDERVCVCGVIKSLRTEPSQNPEANYALRVNMKIADFTGEMPVTLFLKEEYAEKTKGLCVGLSVVVRGKTRAYIGRLGKEMQVTGYAVSACEIGEVKEVPERAVAEEYLFVKPEPFFVSHQTEMFEKEKPIPEFIKKREIVVFDLETTGLKPMEDRIVEIGAVKLKDGVICESFETLIDPQMPMPESATKVNNITDEMLVGQPKITQVIGDFKKFCGDAVLVAHNIDFDYSFIKIDARNTGYRFDNVKWDTLLIARKYYGSRPNEAGTPSNYQLQTIARSLGVKAEDAHRAMDDARVCAEVLLELAAMAGESGIEEVKS